MKKLVLPLLWLPLALSVSCAKLPGALNTAGLTSSSDQSPAAAGPAAVTVDSQQGGSRSGTINLLRPADGGFKTQSIVHRWTSEDITLYVVSLIENGQTLVTVDLNPLSGQDEAVFNHLKFGVTYTVSVVAEGNIGGDPTQPVHVLNAQTPADGTILFTGNNDVENTQNITIQVQLDSVMFDGSATASLSTTDGSFVDPAQAESGYVPGAPTQEATPSKHPKPPEPPEEPDATGDAHAGRDQDSGDS